MFGPLHTSQSPSSGNKKKNTYFFKKELLFTNTTKENPRHGNVTHLLHLQRVTQSKGYSRTENLKSCPSLFRDCLSCNKPHYLHKQCMVLTVCIKDVVRASPVIKPPGPILHHHLWLISLYQNKTKELKLNAVLHSSLFSREPLFKCS